MPFRFLLLPPQDVLPVFMHLVTFSMWEPCTDASIRPVNFHSERQREEKVVCKRRAGTSGKKARTENTDCAIPQRMKCPSRKVGISQFLLSVI